MSGESGSSHASQALVSEPSQREALTIWDSDFAMALQWGMLPVFTKGLLGIVRLGSCFITLVKPVLAGALQKKFGDLLLAIVHADSRQRAACP
jgi:hypothetical protein